MLVSIITINYNDKFGLEKTIKSVQNQTSLDFEHIIIDGNSTDGSKDVINKYKTQFSYFVSEPDSGVYQAMNKGIKAAKGDYVLFINSGDMLESKTVITNSILEFENFDIVYGNLIIEKENGESLLDSGPLDKEITLETLFFSTLNHPATFIKKTLFNTYGFYDESLKIVSDWKFFLITIGLNNILAKHIDVTISRFNLLGVSSLNVDKREQERTAVLKELIPKLIYKDYVKAHKLKVEHNSDLIQKVLKLKKSYLSKKILLIVIKMLLFFTNKNSNS
ncbi:glycosyltransferase family 2 protein [Aurantibacter sp.]|uniref:glycosyltransferase family 2 protein n=1 Tax=Aurantibacter sp. TaxID=2807103 RepID=UPI0035C7B399